MAATPNGSFLDFFKELFQRLFTKSPTFFKIFSWISALAAALTGIPDFLKTFSIILPAPWDVLSNKVIAIASLAVFIMSNLTVKDATQIATAPDDKLPLTAAKDYNVTTPPKQP